MRGPEVACATIRSPLRGTHTREAGIPSGPWLSNWSGSGGGGQPGWALAESSPGQANPGGGGRTQCAIRSRRGCGVGWGAMQGIARASLLQLAVLLSQEPWKSCDAGVSESIVAASPPNLRCSSASDAGDSGPSLSGGGGSAPGPPADTKLCRQ